MDKIQQHLETMAMGTLSYKLGICRGIIGHHLNHSSASWMVQNGLRPSRKPTHLSHRAASWISANESESETDKSFGVNLNWIRVRGFMCTTLWRLWSWLPILSFHGHEESATLSKAETRGARFKVPPFQWCYAGNYCKTK